MRSSSFSHNIYERERERETHLCTRDVDHHVLMLFDVLLDQIIVNNEVDSILLQKVVLVHLQRGHFHY